ncbi:MULTISPECIES: hypothetical protein [unclassified Methanosarcina]|uniref:hypothetical protein n=1 Tax=unclassified Methanosarcina TaxID=2644672 RepID=UPI0006155B6E|nr:MULTISPECIES: hypothetical protein [unclassified Methanosarcina]AKB17167.1 hypothetical protein MSWHS_0304 [Methanosarcina sp. WWM596]AKB20573.1 hypothetical protein MSWH1_0302 [Methanosarcina sp. WH1]
MIKYRKFGVLILSLMMLSVFAVLNVPALSEENDSMIDVPTLPLILRGGLNVDGEPVSEGSEVMAYYEGELIAKSTIGEEGKYNLNLNLTPENYTNIGKVELYVYEDNSSFEIPASEIEAINKTPGSISVIDLEGSVSSADINKSSNSKDSSSNGDSEGDVKIVKKDSEPSEDSAEESSIEEGDSQKAISAEGVNEGSVDMQEPVSQVSEEGSKGAEKSGYSTFFTGLLFITALLGAFYVIKK